MNKMRLALLSLLTLALLPCATAQVSTGTGFAVAPGLLITNHHVIDSCTSIEVVSADGRRRAAVVDGDPLIDLALLRVPGMRGGTAKLRSPNNVRLGEPVMVFPLSGSLTSGGNFTSGLVSGLRGLRDSVGEIQITAPVQPGNSGNPEAEAEVKASADGSITERKLIKSSGVSAWDDAVLRAIDKMKSLPRDTDGRAPSLLVIAARPESAVLAPSQPKPPLPAAPTTSAPPGIELPSINADYPQNNKADYPLVSRKLGEQGLVGLRVLIGTDGVVQKAEISKSSGFKRLDQAALAAVLSWRYAPGRIAGVPKTMWVSVPINFVLE